MRNSLATLSDFFVYPFPVQVLFYAVTLVFEFRKDQGTCKYSWTTLIDYITLLLPKFLVLFHSVLYIRLASVFHVFLLLLLICYIVGCSEKLTK